MISIKQIAIIAICLTLPFIIIDSLGATTKPTKYDIFFLSIGSEHYIQQSENEEDKDIIGFNSIDGANNSAKKIASVLSQCGSIYGITITSDSENIVTKKDVLGNLDLLVEYVRNSNTENPLIIFYFCGHGISEGVGWNHFSVPGNFVGDPKNIDIDELSKKAIHTAQIYDNLKNTKYPYIILLDNCYSGNEAILSTNVFSKSLISNIQGVLDIVRFYNEFKESNPVIFATKPGTEAHTVKDPSKKLTTKNVGWLCRRIWLVLNNNFKKQNNLSIGKFIGKLKDSKLDSITKPAICKSELRSPNNLLLQFPVTQKTSQKLIKGTGSNSKTVDLDDSNEQLKNEDHVYVNEINEKKFTFIHLESESGDFIGNGRTFLLLPEEGDFSVTQQSEYEITFEFMSDDEWWELEFITPNKNRFEKKIYKNAERCDFQSTNKPGMSISGNGKGCSEISGMFNVLDVKYDNKGNIENFYINFEQSCDGAKAVIRGEIGFNN